MNLDEALRQIGRYLYGVQHHERAQRVTHSLEALDEGSGTEMRSRRPPQPLLSGRRERLPSFFFHPAALLRFPQTSKRCFPTPATIIFPFRFHARHWLWIRLGLKAAVGQTITRTTDEANLFIHYKSLWTHFGYYILLSSFGFYDD